jgi:hypothetical protein
MTQTAWLRHFRSLLLLCCLAWSFVCSAQNVIHHGPTLNVEVQRGDERLPLALVNRLRQGDRLLVTPDNSTLTKDGWVLLLAQVSPTGNQVVSKHFEVSQLTTPAELEITADNQVAVIMLAPQLRNLFGLYTSLTESATLLNDVLRGDPQRFYELQKVDQINQAIQAISQGLAKRMAGSKPQESIQAARDLAAKFGIRTIDPECLRNDTVNTECVATQIVINKDFSLPSTSDLNAMLGNKKAVDFNSFLLSNLRMFSEASDYLGNKYRDSYDFAPTFGRRQPSSARVELYSIARFRKGNIKTAYIYVPSWFSGNAPTLQAATKTETCFNRGQLQLQVQGKLPLVNYWHDWQMQVRDANAQHDLGFVTGLSFDPDTARLSFEPLQLDDAVYPKTHEVVVDVKARFGFDALTFKPIRMRLPTKDTARLLQAIEGQGSLVAGEQAQLLVRDAAVAACIDALSIESADGQTVHSAPTTPARLDVDLRQTRATHLKLKVQQSGTSPLAFDLRVLPPYARITRVEHAQSESSLTVTGLQFERVSRIEVGRVLCSTESAVVHPTMPNTWFVTCDGDIRDNAKLPDQVNVVHRNDEPGALRIALSKTTTKPRFAVSDQVPNAMVVSPSPKALLWGLTPTGLYMSEDSGLNLLLQAQAPYALVRGTYVLQLRFKNDPQTESKPIQASLIADFAHNELRTRSPVSFVQAELPSVVNPLEYRISHQPSGLSNEWQTLPRQVLWLPELQGATCSPQGDAIWVHGKRLDLIDLIRVGADTDFQSAQLVSCPKGLCLNLPTSAAQGQLTMRLRWVDDRLFHPTISDLTYACQTPPAQ